MIRFAPILIFCFVLGCAQAPILTGGPKDTYAPSIDSAKTSPYNGQINFTGNKVEMKFNEFISLNKPLQNILVTPQPITNPIITANKKKLTIEFLEPLLENTTYTITFNKAIQDITERNDSVFQYVFSTGDFIDSLQIQGNVIDAFTNLGMTDYLVGLYPADLTDDFDSIPYNNKPMYLAQSSKGSFKLNYLKEGAYYFFAYEDKNANLKLDNDENRAFLDDAIIELTEDVDSIYFRTFLESKNISVVEDYRFQFPGRIEVMLSSPPEIFDLKSDIILLKDTTLSEDSLVFWLAENPVSNMHFYLNLNNEIDTLKPVFKGVPDKIQDVKLTVTHNVKTGFLLPKENLRLVFSEPIKTLKKEMIHVFDKDSNALDLPIIYANTRQLIIETFDTEIHQLVIDSGAVTSVYDRVLEKPLSLLFDNYELDYFSTLILEITGTEGGNAIMQLIDSKGMIARELPVQENMILSELLPGEYELRLILDENNDGIWTTGKLAAKLQPERMIYYKEKIVAKSKWEKEIEWIIELK